LPLIEIIDKKLYYKKLKHFYNMIS